MPKTTSAGESSVWSWDDGTPLEFDDETGAPLPPAPPASEVPVESGVEPETGEVAEESAPEDTRVNDGESVPADEPAAEPVPADESSAQPVDEPVDGPAPFTF